MSKVCVLCGKGAGSGNSVSHSNRRTRRKWQPNLQKAALTIGDSKVSLRVCTRCLRTYKTKLA